MVQSNELHRRMNMISKKEVVRAAASALALTALMEFAVIILGVLLAS
jgi:hypothetical protein